MALVKYLFELVLATIIIFFVWNILKRYSLINFIKFPSLNPRNRENVSPKPAKPTKEQVKWDAETVEYEEVEEKIRGKVKR